MKTTRKHQEEIFLIFINFWPCWAFIAAASGGCFPAVVRGLLPAGASLVAEHGLWAHGTVAVAHRLSWTPTYGIFPDKGSNLCSVYWHVDTGRKVSRREVLKSNIPANPEQTIYVHLYVYLFICIYHWFMYTCTFIYDTVNLCYLQISYLGICLFAEIYL